jgi:hypothetical protein
MKLFGIDIDETTCKYVMIGLILAYFVMNMNGGGSLCQITEGQAKNTSQTKDIPLHNVSKKKEDHGFGIVCPDGGSPKFVPFPVETGFHDKSKEVKPLDSKSVDSEAAAKKAALDHQKGLCNGKNYARCKTSANCVWRGSPWGDGPCVYKEGAKGF